MTGTADKEIPVTEAVMLAQRWKDIHTDESYGPQGKNLGILSRALLESLAQPSTIAATEAAEVIEWLESYANVEENVRRLGDESNPTKGMPDNLRRAVAMIRKLSASSATLPTWIPCGERLPEGDIQVLTLDRDGAAHGKWAESVRADARHAARGIGGTKPFYTHWMPVPPLVATSDGGTK